MTEDFEEPREIGIVTVDIAIDLSGKLAGADAFSVAGDALQSVLTAQMQKFCDGKGAIVDWHFSGQSVRITRTVEKGKYEEGRAFIRLNLRRTGGLPPAKKRKIGHK